VCREDVLELVYDLLVSSPRPLKVLKRAGCQAGDECAEDIVFKGINDLLSYNGLGFPNGESASLPMELPQPRSCGSGGSQDRTSQR
jgi:hypothetical protein